MNDVLFFEDPSIPEPDVVMAAGGSSNSQQTAKIMVAFEELCQGARTDAMLVAGDVNSTLACSSVARKLNIPVAHLEAGLRSIDMSMPEEINRRVTDSISDWFFVTGPSGDAHLQREGKADSASIWARPIRLIAKGRTVGRMLLIVIAAKAAIQRRRTGLPPSRQ